MKKIAKIQKLLQNESNQITEIQNQSRDELERIAKIRRIKIFNNNLDDDKISDIRRILNRLRDILPKRYRKEILKKLDEIENNKNLSGLKKEENDENLQEFLIIKENMVFITME